MILAVLAPARVVEMVCTALWWSLRATVSKWVACSSILEWLKIQDENRIKQDEA